MDSVPLYLERQGHSVIVCERLRGILAQEARFPVTDPRGGSPIPSRAATKSALGKDADERLGLADDAAPQASGETALLLEEVKIGCTLAMLTCLDRPHRLAYILGEILEMDGDEAARVLAIDAAAYRKRLSRAREAVVAFTRAKCGLVNPDRPCRCRRRVSEAVRLGRVTPGQLLFASDAEGAKHFPEVLAEVRRLEDVRRAAALIRSHPDFTAPVDLAARILKLVEGGPPISERRMSGRGDGPA